MCYFGTLSGARAAQPRQLARNVVVEEREKLVLKLWIMVSDPLKMGAVDGVGHGYC